jgi:hypothetical protein
MVIRMDPKTFEAAENGGFSALSTEAASKKMFPSGISPRIDLAGGPDHDAIRDSDALISDLDVRLAGILGSYGCRADDQGWRMLLLHLLLRYEPAFQIQNGQLDNRKDNGDLLYMRREMTWMAHLISTKQISHAEAARRVACETEPDPSKRVRRASTLKKNFSRLTREERTALTPKTSRPLMAERRLALLWLSLQSAMTRLEERAALAAIEEKPHLK